LFNGVISNSLIMASKFDRSASYLNVNWFRRIGPITRIEESQLRDAFSGLFDLARDGPEPLHVQVMFQIKQAVLSGRLPARTRLPSSRILSAKLGVSRNTVLAALDQLKAEGILEARQGAGISIAESLNADLAGVSRRPLASGKRGHRLAVRWSEADKSFQPLSLTDPRPFAPGIPDLVSFPREIWATCLRRAARHADSRTAGYEAMSGHPHFRRVLSAHLAETRGVVAEPEQIVVTSSARGGLGLIVAALLSPGEECWVEEPGFRSPKAAFQAAGGKLIGVPVDADGIDPFRAPTSSRPRLIYVTPSHQFPTGALMSLARRLALIERASQSDGYVIEDDYDSEFQYRGRPIAALQGLDRTGSVLYLGTFAKSLQPGLRVGFVVAPPELAAGLEKVQRHTGQLVAPVLQLALADFIERGHYRAHIRRMKAVYARRLAQFAEGIARHSGGRLSAAMPPGGLQTVVTSEDRLEDNALAARLEAYQVFSQPLAAFHLQPANAIHRGVLMGFSAWDEPAAAKALARLAAFGNAP
jgi:GntR family transcriptional regulator/MocR family aminotransferase